MPVFNYSSHTPVINTYNLVGNDPDKNKNLKKKKYIIPSFRTSSDGKTGISLGWKLGSVSGKPSMSQETSFPSSG